MTSETNGPPAGPRHLSPGELRAWRAFLEAHALVTRQLEADLAGSGLTLADYDVLVQLAFAEERRLRMHELAERVVLSRGGITRLVDRLAARGLATRVRCASDARGTFAVLTEAGLERLRGAAPGHFESVRRNFLERLSPDELGRLTDLLERVPARRVRRRSGSRADSA
ncbi:MAG: hypothetical protein A2X23_08480 [Chloroflexi bacterium GWC2_73_18]|nr:MAG: hypothetical protein A2X23_08480 [Chloroflexi bacterium GWC2_73_18]